MEDAKSVVLQVEEAWRSGALDRLDDLIAPDLANHDAIPGLPPGLAGAKAGHAAFLRSFPDRKLSIEHVVAEDDLVAVHTRGTATHTGEPFFGVAAAGREVTLESISIYRVRDGKVVEHWGLNATWNLIRQLGAAPRPGS